MLFRSSLLAGYYLNELLLRLVPGGDQNEHILSCYSKCLDQLATTRSAARALRLFELELLEALGYRVDLEHDFRTGKAIEPESHYKFEHENGLTACDKDSDMNTFSGRQLISLRQHELDDPDSLGAAKRLLGRILEAHLGGRPLKTREVMRAIADRDLAR